MSAPTFDELMAPVEDYEDIGERFAQFLAYAIDSSALNWSTDLARSGADPTSLRMMAGRWRENDFEPSEYAGALESFADGVQRMTD
jgi:hypothetical protein